MKAFTIMLIVALLLSLSFAEAETNEEHMNRLKERFKKQSEKIKTLQDKLDRAEKEENVSTKEVVDEYVNKNASFEEAGIYAGYGDQGFFIRSADDTVRLHVSGWLQGGVAVFEDRAHDDNSAFLDTSAVVFDLYAYQKFHVKFEVIFRSYDNFPRFQDGANGVIDFRDLYIEYNMLSEVNFIVGNTRVAFSMEGQYNENEHMSIWPAAFTYAWGHHRDPGIVIWGLLADTLEYKLGVHNGDGSGVINNSDDLLGGSSDDMLFSASLRFFPLSKSKNAKTFFHIGVIHSRDTSFNQGPGTTINGGAQRATGVGRVNSAFFATPWGRPVFANGVPAAPGPDDATSGWKTGESVGMRIEMYLDNAELHNIRFESEFMHMRWQRDFTEAGGNRLPWLEGFGVLAGLKYKFNYFSPDTKEAGVFALFKFSYTDVDDIGKNSSAPGGEIIRQRMWVWTYGLGYTFNKHFSIQANAVVVDLKERELYGGAVDTPRGSNNLEYGWFGEVTIQW